MGSTRGRFLNIDEESERRLFSELEADDLPREWNTVRPKLE